MAPQSSSILKGGVVIPLMFPEVPQSSLGIHRVWDQGPAKPAPPPMPPPPALTSQER